MPIPLVLLAYVDQQNRLLESLNITFKLESNKTMIFKLLLLLFVAQFRLCSQILQQQDLALTIYSNGQALVTDTRKIAFDKGTSQLNFTDVASSIKPQTVIFTPNNQTSNITILQQTYQDYLALPFAILRNYIDRDVVLEVTQGNNVIAVSGKLLYIGDIASGNDIVIQDPTSVTIYRQVNVVKVKARPEDVLMKPSLVWNVYSDNAVTTSCVVGYRTSRIEWKADYLVSMNEDENKADLSGWVTIINNSGKKYLNTRIKLIAEEMKATPEYRPPSYQVKSFSGEQKFTLSHPVNLNTPSRKQIEFIPKIYNISVTKTYEFDVPILSMRVYDPIKFQTTYKISNSKWNKLGIPMPAGTVVFYRTNKVDKILQLMSESSISSTPKDEKVIVKVGNSPDLLGRIFFEQVTPFGLGKFKVQFNITNRGIKPAPVVLNKNYSDTEFYYITQNPGYTGPRWKRVNADKYEMLVTVPANRTQIIEWNFTNKS